MNVLNLNKEQTSLLKKYCWFICKIYSFDKWINRNFFLKKIREKKKINCEANIVDSFTKYISFDKLINKNFFKIKKRPNLTQLWKNYS